MSYHGPFAELDSLWELRAEPSDLRKRISAKLDALGAELGDRDPVRAEALRMVAEMLRRI